MIQSKGINKNMNDAITYEELLASLPEREKLLKELLEIAKNNQ